MLCIHVIVFCFISRGVLREWSPVAASCPSLGLAYPWLRLEILTWMDLEVCIQIILSSLNTFQLTMKLDFHQGHKSTLNIR